METKTINGPEAFAKRNVPFESREEMAERLDDFYMNLRGLCEQYQICQLYSVLNVKFKTGDKDKDDNPVVDGGMLVSMIGDTTKALDFAAFGYGFEKSLYDGRIQKAMDMGKDIAKESFNDESGAES